MSADTDFALNQIAAAVQTVAGYVPLSVRYRAAAAALMVVEEYFAATIPPAPLVADPKMMTNLITSGSKVPLPLENDGNGAA